MARSTKANWNRRLESVIFRAVPLLCFSALIAELMIQSEVAAWTYHYSTKAYSWNVSRAFCRKYYTDLVAIQNKNEIAHLNEVIPYYSSYYWIGIRKINNVWTWVGTKKSLTKEAENWADNEPNNKRNNQDCVEIYIKSQSAPGKWNDEPCWKKKLALCYTASCQDMSCSKQGECMETIGNYTCSCYPGFYGPECEHVRECGELDLPQNVLMNCSHPLGNFSFNSQCHFHCPEGFTLKGPGTLECSASGNWTDIPPQCVATLCPPLETPAQGSMACRHSAKDFQHQSSCSFRCDEGFTLVGPEEVRCTASGVWTSPAPVCRAAQCRHLEVPSKGTMDCTHPLAAFAFGSSCKFKCQPGYRMRGLGTLRCIGSGQWTAPLPTCEAIACDPVESPAHGSMDCSPSSRGFQYNTSYSFRCAEGFRLRGAEMVRCSDLGQWTAPVPVCQALQCQGLRVPRKAQMNCSHPFGAFMYQSSCSFTCDEGLLLVGASMLQCLATGTWSAVLPECQAITCAPLLSPQNGTMTCVQPLGDSSYKSMCRFRCDEGFSLSGPERLYCTSSGHWTGSSPTCEAFRCPELFSPEQGSMDCSDTHGEFRVSSTCRFSCSKGFKLKGSQDVECTASGKWTAPPPTCEGIAPAPASAIQCPVLVTPEQGTMACKHHRGTFGLNTACYFGCHPGFTLMGASPLRCSSPGQWTAAVPTCRAGPLTVQQALTYFGGAVASTSGLLMGGTLLALLRRRCRQKDDGKSPLSPQSHLGTYGVFTNAAFDPNP
ncbi:P-selectin [Echinops telfairi]|uniref:p-selectin n=1 Tax=Echinops telfairi TaxID=9371 RepID=A0AC55DQ83_ECHTE|nr:P-selectin [Echinops telfairi]